MTERHTDGDRFGGPYGPPWPGRFPHPEIDALQQRLDEDCTDPAATERAMRLIGEEARRLRATAMRLAARRIEAAQNEASDILRTAQEQADELRALGFDVLLDRIHEADTVAATLQDVVRRARRSLDETTAHTSPPPATDTSVNGAASS